MHQLDLPDIGPHERDLSAIFHSIPQIDKLSFPVKSQLNEIVERRLRTLGSKIRSSPYAESEFSNAFGINSSLTKATNAWLQQFDKRYRLGYLLGILSIIYITESEERLFFDIARQSLFEQILDRLNERPKKPPILRREVIDKFRPYAVSTFSQFDYFVKSLGLSGFRDRDRLPFRENVDTAISELSKSLAYLAENDPKDVGEIYYHDHHGKILDFIRSTVSASILLVEDCSFSGTRIKSKTRTLLRIMREIFSQENISILHSRNLSPPWVYLVVSYGTETAAREVHRSRLEDEGYPYCDSIFGHIFPEQDSVRSHLPLCLHSLEEFFPKLSLQRIMQDSCEHFLDRYGHLYLEETGVAKGANISKDDLLLGFKNGGWTIIGHGNCANNSLTYFWFPISNAKRNHEISALFPRIDSHVSHANTLISPKDFLDRIDNPLRVRLQGVLRNIFTRKLPIEK